MRFRFAVVLTSLVFLSAATLARAQAPSSSNPPAKLADLLREAERNNPEIQAARQSWRSAQQVPSQVSTLPDPQVMVQQVSVGSPRPFSGYTNSEMADIGLGISQDIPFPGKLRLRGEIAEKQSEVQQQQYESVRRKILADVKAAYFQLSYLATRLSILRGDGQLLAQIEQSAEARYRTGMTSQQDVLQAQLEQTQLLREVTMTQLASDTTQAKLKQLLNRAQTSADISTVELTETPVPYTYEQLWTAAGSSDPNIASAQHMVEKSGLRVNLAHKDFDPDFNVTYMWLRTDPFQYRAHYMLTFGMRIPIYRKRREEPALVEAQADQTRAQNNLDVQRQQVAASLRQFYAIEEKSTDLLKIYREGLQPQARAEFQAGLAAYQSNREDFQALLASFLDVLKVDEEFWQTLSEHETARAQIEEVTGLSLR
jgi:outer membrane protein, heavy metal efflux system